MREWLSTMVLAVSLGGFGAAYGEEPDIVWILAEDISNELACYGEPGVKTPHLDQLASEGTRYERAYCTGPGCSTSRSAMMSGVYQTRLDAHDHRRVSNTRFPALTECLRKAGYYNAVGCGYSAKTDLNFKPTAKLFDGRDWKKARRGQPFYAQTTLYGTHRMDEKEKKWQAAREASRNPVDLASVRLPPYYPDVPEVRLDWARYLDQIEKMDSEVGEIVERLKKEKRYDDALIIFCGDNGRCHLRGKNWLYEPGLKVPLIIKWPKGERAGEVVSGMVSMLDVTATVMELAGARPTRPIDGQSLAGEDAPIRKLIFGARDGGGNVMDRIRSVCDGRWKYIRNYRPELGFEESKYTQAHRPMLNIMERMKEAGELNEAQLLVLQRPKDKEELYDLENDPDEIHNLAAEPGQQETITSLGRLLDAWISETGDTGIAEDKEN